MNNKSEKYQQRFWRGQQQKVKINEKEKKKSEWKK